MFVMKATGEKEVAVTPNFSGASDNVQFPRNTMYKELYYSSLEVRGNLQKQLVNCSELLSKHKKIADLKTKLLSCISARKTSLDSFQETLDQRQEELKAKLEKNRLREEKLKQEHGVQLREKKEETAKLRQALANSIVKATLIYAENLMKEEQIAYLKTKQVADTEKVKSRFTKYGYSLHRKYKEMKEACEFNDAERASLAEANFELESQVKTLGTKLQATKLALEQARSKQERVKKEVCESLLHLPEELRASSESCCTCAMLRKQLLVVTDVLNDKSVAKYGDLLHSKFLLQQKLTRKEHEFAEATMEFQHLGRYFSEYKSRSTEKVAILKDNVKKADEEIAELDKLVESMIEALHDNMEVVQCSPSLLQVLQDIEGVHKSP